MEMKNNLHGIRHNDGPHKRQLVYLRRQIRQEAEDHRHRAYLREQVARENAAAARPPAYQSGHPWYVGSEDDAARYGG